MLLAAFFDTDRAQLCIYFEANLSKKNGKVAILLRYVIDTNYQAIYFHTSRAGLVLGGRKGLSHQNDWQRLLCC